MLRRNSELGEERATWTLIRVVPPGAADRVDMDLDRRNRQDIEQDIFMERELFRW